jgi:hypothetical protein
LTLRSLSLLAVGGMCTARLTTPTPTVSRWARCGRLDVSLSYWPSQLVTGSPLLFLQTLCLDSPPRQAKYTETYMLRSAFNEVTFHRFHWLLRGVFADNTNKHTNPQTHICSVHLSLEASQNTTCVVGEHTAIWTCIHTQVHCFICQRRSSAEYTVTAIRGSVDHAQYCGRARIT